MLIDNEILPQKGFRHLCETLSDDVGKAAIFYYDNNEISSEIAAWNKFFIHKQDPVYLIDTRNRVISMFDNIVSHGQSGFSDRKCVINYIHSNIAIVGYERWLEKSTVKRVEFTLSGAESIFKRGALFERFCSGAQEKPDDFKIFNLKTERYQVRIRFSGTSSHDAVVIFELEFYEPKNLDSYFDELIYFSRFFTLISGDICIPQNISISSITRKKFISEVSRGSNDVELFYVIYKWDDDYFKKNVFNNPLVWADSRSSLNKIKAALKAWVNRFDDWVLCISHMDRCLLAKNEVSHNRILSAYKWFEHLPNAKKVDAIDDKAAYEVALAAQERADSLNLDIDVKGRFVGFAKTIKTESYNQHIERVIRRLRNSFKIINDFPSLLDDIKGGREYRGRAAHSHVIDYDDKDFQNYVNSIESLEFLSFLLTIEDLGLDELSDYNYKNSQFVSAYYMARDMGN